MASLINLVEIAKRVFDIEPTANEQLRLQIKFEKEGIENGYTPNIIKSHSELLTVKWKTDICHTGEDCWCRLIVPVEPTQYEDGDDAYIVPDGCISKQEAEYLVELHNKSIAPTIDQTIDQTIQNLEKAFSDLNEYFGGNVVDSPLYIDCPWIVTGSNSDICFAYAGTEVNNYDDLGYSNEIVGGLYEKEDYTAVYVDNGCGDQYWMVLKNSNRRKDIEEQDD